MIVLIVTVDGWSMADGWIATVYTAKTDQAHRYEPEIEIQLTMNEPATHTHKFHRVKIRYFLRFQRYSQFIVPECVAGPWLPPFVGIPTTSQPTAMGSLGLDEFDAAALVQQMTTTHHVNWRKCLCFAWQCLTWSPKRGIRTSVLGPFSRCLLQANVSPWFL